MKIGQKVQYLHNLPKEFRHLVEENSGVIHGINRFKDEVSLIVRYTIKKDVIVKRGLKDLKNQWHKFGTHIYLTRNVSSFKNRG